MIDGSTSFRTLPDGVLNYASLNFGSAYCSDSLRINLEEVPVAEIYRRSSKLLSIRLSPILDSNRTFIE
jgi:hypothetical protein